MMPCPCCGSPRIRSVSIEESDYQSCRKCRFLFRRDSTTPGRELVAKHYESVDPHRQVAESKKAFFRHVLRRLEQSSTDEKRLLDVGCGYGYFLEAAAARGWQTCGVEISFEAATESRRKFGDADVFLGKLQESGFASNRFAAVTFWDVLVFSDSPFADLLECLRVLKQGGMVGIRVRNVLFQKTLYHLFVPFSSAARQFGIKKPYVFHPNCFSPRSIRFLLQRVGFVGIRIENSPLTSGDPYEYSRFGGVTRLAKRLAGSGAKWMRQLSRGKWIWGPSLLIWARKP